MQNLDVISVNIWHILISLINLCLLFLIVKKFLFKPVRKLLASRQADIDGLYSDAEKAKEEAYADKAAWEEKLSGAKTEADSIIADAADIAKHRAEAIVEEANERAEHIVRTAELDAQLERKRAEEDIKREIASVSAAIAEKMLEREIDEGDHRAMIESFIEDLDTAGESDDGNK